MLLYKLATHVNIQKTGQTHVIKKTSGHSCVIQKPGHTHIIQTTVHLCVIKHVFEIIVFSCDDNHLILLCVLYFFRVPSGTWKLGDLNIICPGLEIAWNLCQKVRKPGQNKKFSRISG